MLGKMINRARVEKGISLRVMAESLCVSAMYLSEIENERRTPIDDQLFFEISCFLDIDFRTLQEVASNDKAEQNSKGN